MTKEIILGAFRISFILYLEELILSNDSPINETFKQCQVYANEWRSNSIWKLCLTWSCLFILFGNVMPLVAHDFGLKAYKWCLVKFFLGALFSAHDFFLVVKTKKRLFSWISQIILNSFSAVFSQTTEQQVTIFHALNHYFIYSCTSQPSCLMPLFACLMPLSACL